MAGVGNDSPVGRQPVARRGGPTWHLIRDLFGDARASGNWFALIVLGVVALAAAITFLSQTVVPWLIYPAL